MIFSSYFVLLIQHVPLKCNNFQRMIKYKGNTLNLSTNLSQTFLFRFLLTYTDTLCGWLLFNPLGFRCTDSPWGSRLPSRDMSCISTQQCSLWPWYGQAVGYLKPRVVSAQHVKRCPEHTQAVSVTEKVQINQYHSALRFTEVNWNPLIFTEVGVSGHVCAPATSFMSQTPLVIR